MERGLFFTPEVYSMKKIYTNDQKDEFLKMYWSGESVASISESTGVAKSTLTKAVEERHPREGLIFHSDCGTNFC